MSNSESDIQRFLEGSVFAVVGASEDRSKYGNKVLRCYMQNGRQAIPINPKSKTIEGQACYTDLESVPGTIDAVSFITPPRITESVVQVAVRLGIQHLWMQPGAESEQAIHTAEAAGMNVIAGGPCLLVVLGFREE